MSTVTRERGREQPAPISLARRRLDVHAMTAICLAVYANEHTGAVEIAMSAVEVRAAHRHVPGVDVIEQRERAQTRRAAPAMLVELAHCQRDGFGLGPQLHHVLGELADHVTAGNPRRQRLTLPGWFGVGYHVSVFVVLGLGRFGLVA